MGYETGIDVISRGREREHSALKRICKAQGIEISAPQKSHDSLVVEKYKEYARTTKKVDAKQRKSNILKVRLVVKN